MLEAFAGREASINRVRTLARRSTCSRRAVRVQGGDGRGGAGDGGAAEAAEAVAATGVDEQAQWALLVELQTSVDAANERMLKAQAKVTELPDAELIDLSLAECSWKADEEMIRAAIVGQEAAIMTLVAGLIRESVRKSIEARASLAEQRFAKAHGALVERYASLRPVRLGEAGEVAARREEATAKAVKRWKHLAHVVPVGLVQSWTLTDVVVVVQLAQRGGPQWVIGASVAGAWRSWGCLWLGRRQGNLGCRAACNSSRGARAHQCMCSTRRDPTGHDDDKHVGTFTFRRPSPASRASSSRCSPSRRS